MKTKIPASDRWIRNHRRVSILLKIWNLNVLEENLSDPDLLDRPDLIAEFRAERVKLQQELSDLKKAQDECLPS